MPKRVLCTYGIDVDAVSGWLNTRTGAPANPTDISRGIFGATVGIDRFLRLLDKYNIKATWFVPGHTAESFPGQIRKIVDRGHEIALHGYTHEFVSSLSEEQQRCVLQKSIQVLTELTGRRPRGWTAPAWSTSRETVRLLEENGIEYDHSFMHHDSQPYYLPDPLKTTTVPTHTSHPASHWMTPMTPLRASSIVEIPANWHLDDWPPFQLALGQPGTHGYVDTGVIERLWKEQFTFLYRECGGDGDSDNGDGNDNGNGNGNGSGNSRGNRNSSFVFPISVHPQVSGKPQVVLLHERFIEWVNGHEGVEWVTMEQIVDEFKSGTLGGVEVEGGVEVGVEAGEGAVVGGGCVCDTTGEDGGVPG